VQTFTGGKYINGQRFNGSHISRRWTSAGQNRRQSLSEWVEVNDLRQEVLWSASLLVGSFVTPVVISRKLQVRFSWKLK